MNINIKTIPESEQRKEVNGADWWWDDSGNLQVRISPSVRIECDHCENSIDVISSTESGLLETLKATGWKELNEDEWICPSCSKKVILENNN